MDEVEGASKEQGTRGGPDGPVPAEPTVRRRLRWPIVVAALVVAGGLAAVSLTSSTSASAESVVASAASSSLAAGSYSFTMVGSVSVLSRSVTITGSGTAEPAERAVQLTASYAAPSLGGSSSFDEILCGSTVYLSGALLDGKIPGGATWISVDVRQLTALEGTSGSESSGTDPTAMLRTLEKPGSGVTVTDLGPGTVDGASAHLYRADISAAALTKRIDSSSIDAATRAQIEATLGGSDETLTLAIDKDNHLAQIKLSSSTPAAGKAISFSLQIDMSGWGGSYSISPPPASEVFDATSVFSGAGGSTGASDASGATGTGV